MRVNCHHLKNRLLGLCPEIRSFNQGRDCYIAFEEDIGDILKDAKQRNYDDDACSCFRKSCGYNSPRI